MKKNIIIIIICLICCVDRANAVEDTSTWTLGGTDVADLSQTTTRITAASTMLDQENGYAIKDFGAGAFGAFSVKGTFRPATTGSSSLEAFICFSNTANLDMGGMNSANDGICVRFKRVGTDGYTIRDFDNGTSVSTDIAGANDTTRYWTFDRTAADTTCTLHIYTDASFTTDDTGSPQTLTCSSASGHKYRYMYLWATGGTDGFASSQSSGYVENVTIVQQDAATGGGEMQAIVTSD